MNGCQGNDTSLSSYLSYDVTSMLETDRDVVFYTVSNFARVVAKIMGFGYLRVSVRVCYICTCVFVCKGRCMSSRRQTPSEDI